MLFQVYGENAMYQWLGWIMVFVSLIAANEVARRSKTGGIVCFLGIPAVLTVYFISIWKAYPLKRIMSNGIVSRTRRR